LEAVVALVIMAAVVIPMLSFIGQMARGLNTAAEANERSFAQQAAVALLAPLNPLLEPTGQTALESNVIVTWTSQELVPPNDTMLTGGLLGGFRLGFYRVVVSLTRSDKEGEWFNFEMRKIGYERLGTSISGGR
jgi:hypothetical protein